MRMGLLFLGLGISVTFLANKSFLSQRKSLDDSSNSIETRQNKSLLGHLPYKEAPKKDLILFSPGIYVHKDIYEKFKEMQFIAAQRGVSLQLLSGYRSINLQRDIFYENKSIRNQTAVERSRDSAPPVILNTAQGMQSMLVMEIIQILILRLNLNKRLLLNG